MDSAYSIAQIQALEAAAMSQLPEGVLMQRAAAGLARVAVEELLAVRGRVYGASVLIVVGPGNNGGDALFAGARLARRGARVIAVRTFGDCHREGLAALLAAGGQIVELADVLEFGPEADLAIDGVLGIGGRPGLPAAVADLMQTLTDNAIPLLAVDLPSGVDATTGAAPQSSVRASRTATFGALKPCHVIEPARSHCGVIDLIDIGLGVAESEPTLLAHTAADLARNWPYPARMGDKYSRGVVGIDTGSERYPGAGILSAHGAVFAGAGMVRYLGPEAAAAVIRAELPNVVYAPGRVQALLLGSGWGERDDGEQVIAEAVESGTPVVIDADGLRYLPEDLPESCLLTPHAGELARLLDCDRREVEADPIWAVQAGADQTGGTVLLKGATQLVATPGVGPIEIAVPGPGWTAQAGSGDVLAGICAAVLAAGRSAAEAAVLGASLQAVSAASAPGPWPPQELARQIPGVLAALQRQTMGES